VLTGSVHAKTFRPLRPLVRRDDGASTPLSRTHGPLLHSHAAIRIAPETAPRRLNPPAPQRGSPEAAGASGEHAVNTRAACLKSTKKAP